MLTHSLALIITYPCEVRDYSGKEKPRYCRLFPTTFSQISWGGRTRVCFSFSCCNRKSRRHSGVLVIPVKLGGSQFFGRLCSVEVVILFSQLRSVVAYKASSPFFYLDTALQYQFLLSLTQYMHHTIYLWMQIGVRPLEQNIEQEVH